MARTLGPVCRLCRREGSKLFLKGDRCYTEKCSVDRRAYPPGQHGQARPLTIPPNVRHADGFRACAAAARAARRGLWASADGRGC